MQLNFFSGEIEANHHAHEKAIHECHMWRRPYTIYKDVFWYGPREMPITFGWEFRSGRIIPRDAKSLAANDK